MLRIFNAHRGDAIVVPGRGARHWQQISTRPTRDVPVGDPAMGGHAGFALGLALARPADRVVLFDSEGDLLMSLGILPTVAELAPANFYHFMLDNECYATTGGQPVPNAKNVAYDVIARGAGYPRAFAFDKLEGFDRSDGIYSRHNGEVIAQGELGLPIFVGVMQFTTRAVIDHVKASAEPLRPGDIFIVNDPYCGGTHLMDVKMVKPYFYRGELWAYLSNTGHWPDTGGSVPGGFSTRATEVQQEGLRLPPVKLFREGVMQADILSIILANIRVPEERIGDLQAQR